MRLFSEKVSPTFTSSNLNILTVEDFQEVFFDVFEFEINGKKLIAEKVSEYKGSPVVDIPLVLEGKEFIAPFVLQRGSFEILFNKDNSSYVRDVDTNEVKPVFEHKSESERVEEIIFEKKENILSEIAQARQLAEKYAKHIKQQKIDEATQYFNKRRELLEEEINESKKGLLDEFLALVESVKSEFFEFNEIEKGKLSTFIEECISNISDELIHSINEKQKLAEEKFSEQINELATNVLTGVLLKEINANNTKNTNDINERFELITSSVKGLVDLSAGQIHEEINSKLSEYGDAIVNLEKVNIELNDQINRGDNKALSRIGNVKTQLEETITKSISDINDRFEVTTKNIETLNESKTHLETLILESEAVLLSRVSEAEDKIKTFYDNKMSLVEEKVEDLSLENKQYFIDLINDSKQSLLSEIANIKVDVPNIIIEKSNGKKEVDLKGIKTELEKIIGTRFSNELQSLKRLIEMSSGGGSVAKQFAAGGTMEGTLNVTGQYLSAGVNLLDIFSGGGSGSADRLVNGSYQVVLSSNGDLTLPGAIVTASNSKLDLVNFGPNTAYLTTTPDDSTALFMGANVAELRANTYASITTNTGDTPRLWEFSTDGGLVFPDGSTQTTAFTNNFLNLSGGTVTGSLSVNSLSAARIYTTQLDVLSANINVIDIKQYELSGFNVQGNATITGNISASGILTVGTRIDTNSLRIYGNTYYTQINPFPLLSSNVSFTFPNSSGVVATNNTAVMLAGAQSVSGAKTFTGQIELTNQQATSSTSALTRQLGDLRYGTISNILSAPVTSITTNFVPVVSITLPIGIYQIDAFMASAHASAAGCKIRLSTSTNIKVGITDNYGRPTVAAFSWPIIDELYNNAHPYAIRSDTGGVEYRRTITGIVEVITNNTVVSLDYAQVVATPLSPSTARVRSHILARQVN
jgi:hypothetical protein